MSCAEAIRAFAAARDAAGVQACIVDTNGRYVGTVSLKACLNAAQETEIAGLMRRDAPTAGPDRTAESVALEMIDRRIEFLPVVDANGIVAGVVSGAAASRYVVEELREDQDRFAGVAGSYGDDYFEHTVWSDFLRRFPWVLGLAVAGLAAGYVVHIYEDALDALVILALYMPMVADTGGNVGTQSASLVTRALTAGDVQLKDSLRILWRETRVSLLMAVVLFLFAFLKVVLISNAADVPSGLSLEAIGFAIAIALAVQVISATLIGALLPLGAIAVKQDPAIISGPALTTIVDLTGLLLYFVITTSLLGITNVVQF
ncbi:magnesium transporter [Martelella alba]|uniref:Magnesium transporter n=2 Tax=Martelella alba TaxID=2590451 RepID=A0A506UK64_9HYPH|nr:magnesium transporter [Martelella alba]